MEEIGKVFSLIFTIEAIIKIIAMGFIVHKKSYIRDPWNILDFLVVVIGLIEFMPFLP